MANLDKLLRKIEQNKATENEVKTYPLTIGGETFEVATMSKVEKRQFVYAQETNKTTLTVGDMVKKMKPFIYKSLNLKDLAVRAKDEGLINSFYDVVEALFEPEEIVEIIAFLAEINNVNEKVVEDEINEIKKP